MKIGLIDADLMWGKHANGRRYGKKWQNSNMKRL